MGRVVATPEDTRPVKRTVGVSLALAIASRLRAEAYERRVSQGAIIEEALTRMWNAS